MKITSETYRSLNGYEHTLAVNFEYYPYLRRFALDYEVLTDDKTRATIFTAKEKHITKFLKEVDLLWQYNQFKKDVKSILKRKYNEKT